TNAKEFASVTVSAARRDASHSLRAGTRIHGRGRASRRPTIELMHSTLSRSVALNILGGFGSLGVGFATSLLLANWLGAADRGLLAILITASSVGLSLSGLGLPMAVMYFASRKDVAGSALLGDTLLFGIVLTLVFVPGP